MRHRPAPFAPGTRDVIGAWLVCMAVAAGCFTLLAAAAPERGGSQAALINPGPMVTVAAAQNHRPGRC
jgi:hypothetical protein